MAKFANGIKVKDVLEQQFKCPRCPSFLKPPIFQCTSGHPICQKCWEKEEKCSKCYESYKKELKPDAYPGHVIYHYRCDHCAQNPGNGGAIHDHGYCSIRNVLGGAEPSELTCEVCNRKTSKRYPLNGVLVTEEEFATAKQAFEPSRNLHLEALAASVLFPCENDGCKELVTLADKAAHENNCVCIAVPCPIDSCDWKAPIPIHSIADHFHGYVHDSVEFIRVNDGKDFECAFEVPVGLLDPNRPDKRDEIVQKAVLLKNGESEFLLVLSMVFPTALDFQIRLSLAVQVIKSEWDKLSFEARFKSAKFEAAAFTYSVTAQNVAEARQEKKWLNIPSLSFFNDNGYVTKDYRGQRIKVEFAQKERPPMVIIKMQPRVRVKKQKIE